MMTEQQPIHVRPTRGREHQVPSPAGAEGKEGKYLVVATGLGHVPEVAQLAVHCAQALAGDAGGFDHGPAHDAAAHVHLHALVIRRQLACHEIGCRQDVLCIRQSAHILSALPLPPEGVIAGNYREALQTLSL